ncbi:amino acid permease [Aureobasidium pullulans]|uniref:Amino acid permease n=1 Tax=Aureobasidium pullulans TaxID=5580 RepID=A0A4S9DDQ9_AURPU|nr:amino acid permease [Aureobasidium pullulans]
MPDHKDEAFELQTPISEKGYEMKPGQGIKSGTARDAADMMRLGKKQEFRRNFHAFSMLGLSSVLMGTWQALIGSASFSLVNGGLAGSTWSYIATWICTITVTLSLAEMASMAPTSGGQYHWTSEFAPAQYQKSLSYFVGWLSALGWQASIALTSFAAGNVILELASIMHPTYTPALWHGTLMTILMAVLAVLVNTVGAKRLPLLEATILFLHIFGFFAVLIPLWVIAPKVSAKEAFTSFANTGGWSSVGAAVVIGQLTAVGSLGGSDAPAHLAEEVANASYVVPRVMLATVLLNGAMGLISIITFVLCITDYDAMVVNNPSFYPYISIFQKAIGSDVGATLMTTLFILLNFCACLSVLAAASRQIFSFARDKGLPFSGWFRQIVTIGTPIPLNAILFSLSITVVLALVNLGSTTAFNSIVGLLAGSGGFSYSVSIACVLWRKIRGMPLPQGRFSLGVFGIPINAFAVLYMIQQAIISFFPMFAIVTVKTMNYGCVMFGGVAIISVVYFVVRGRHVYKGPVVDIHRD